MCYYKTERSVWQKNFMENIKDRLPVPNQNLDCLIQFLDLKYYPENYIEYNTNNSKWNKIATS